MKNTSCVSMHRRKRNPPAPKKVVRKNENVPLNASNVPQRYLKQETLGEGAFGLVYKAFDQETGKTVAIKCLKTKESIESFQAELDLLKRLHHPAIVPYIDSFYDGKGSLQIVMEYADNGSILDVIHKYGNLNENVAAIYISQVLQGLAYLHKQNVLHRDIKAANILIQCGVAKLADFGLALDLNEYGHTLRECAGTPYWMAPEVINGDPVDHKSDIWSVGSTTIELLKGRPPFFDLAPLPAMFQIAGERSMPIPSDVSEKCKKFLLLCFKKNPKERPDACDLLENDWIQQSLQIVKQAESSMKNKKRSQDFRSLSLCLESICGSISALQKQKRSPEEIIFDLNDESLYEESVFNTIQMLNTKKSIPQLVLNFCGIRTLIERLENKKYRTVTFNFIQELVSKSNRISTSLIEHTLLYSLFRSKSIHAQITGIFIIMSSNVGGKLFFATGMNNFLEQIFSSPLLKIFFPTFMLYLLSCDLPTDLIVKKLFTSSIIKMIVEISFKSMALMKEYRKLFDGNFKSMKSVQSKDDLLSKRLSNSLFEKTFQFIDDSITLLKYTASSVTEIQIMIANEINPIIYVFLNSTQFSNLTSRHISSLILTLDSLYKDCVARNRVRSDLLIEPLVTFSYSEDKEVSTSSLHCLTRMLMNRPELVEQAVDTGLCLSLSFASSKQIAINFVRHLICYIPTVSKFAAYKMKEADLFYILLDLLTVLEWRDKAIKAIASWASFDPAYVDQQLSNDSTDFSLSSLIDTCIEMIKNCHIRLSSFFDLKMVIRRCQMFTQSLTNDDLIQSILLALKSAGEYQSDLLELLLEIILQANDPTIFASSVLPKLKGYSESSDFRVQKTVLRIRVVSGC